MRAAIRSPAEVRTDNSSASPRADETLRPRDSSDVLGGGAQSGKTGLRGADRRIERADGAGKALLIVAQMSQAAVES